MRRPLLLASSLFVLAALGGCTTLGGNVKGSFSCVAPDGVCAPSSTIDDRALAMISGEAGDTMISPAGPYPEPRSEGRGFQSASALPARTRERVLRIVFPAQIDASGRLHEQTAVHAVVEQGDWQQALAADAVATTPRQMAARAGEDTLLAAVEHAEPPVSGADQDAAAPEAPSAAAVAAARATGATSQVFAAKPIADPIGDIKDQVAKRLLPRSPRLQVIPSALSATTPTYAARSDAPRPGAAAASKSIPPAPPSPTRVQPNEGPVASQPVPSAPSRPVPAAISSIAVPAHATPAGRAAVAAVAASPSLRGAMQRGEADARAAAKTAGPLRVLRASSFPGVEP